MATPISIEDLLRFIMFLLGIGVLAYLFMVFKNMAETLKVVKNIATEAEADIIKTITEAQLTTTNISSITSTADETLKAMAPEIDGIVHSTNEVAGKLESMTTVLDNATHKVGDTVDDVTDNISDAAYQINSNLSNISGYLSIFNEIVEIIKNTAFKR